jgi:hypothetical protein
VGQVGLLLLLLLLQQRLAADMWQMGRGVIILTAAGAQVCIIPMHAGGVDHILQLLGVAPAPARKPHTSIC